MFKVIVLVLLFCAVVYSLPSPSRISAAESSVQAANGEINAESDKDDLDTAEFKWKIKKLGFKKFFPVYKSFYYPGGYYPQYYNNDYYNDYNDGWW